MRRQYDRWVGISIPERSLQRANEIAANITENSANAQTFARQATMVDGSLHYVTKVPMRESIYKTLPVLQEELGGIFTVLATRTYGAWEEHLSFEDWLSSAGLTLVPWNDDFESENED
jgi:hypothetical protein